MKNSTRSETETYDRRLQIANSAATVAITLISLLTLVGCVAAFRASFLVFPDDAVAATLQGSGFACLAAVAGTLLFAMIIMEKHEYLTRLGERPSTDKETADKQQPLIRSFNSGKIHLLSDPESGAQYLVSRVRYWARYRFWSMWTMQRVEHEDIGVSLSVHLSMPVDRGREAVNRRLTETFHSAQAHAAYERKRNRAAVGVEKEAALAR